MKVWVVPNHHSLWKQVETDVRTPNTISGLELSNKFFSLIWVEAVEIGARDLPKGQSWQLKSPSQRTSLDISDLVFNIAQLIYDVTSNLISWFNTWSASATIQLLCWRLKFIVWNKDYTHWFTFIKLDRKKHAHEYLISNNYKGKLVFIKILLDWKKVHKGRYPKVSIVCANLCIKKLSYAAM